MKKDKLTRITLITTVQHHESIADALREIEGEYGRILDCHVYPSFQIETGHADETAFRENLRRSDVVLVDVRSANKTSKILHEELDHTDQTVISMVGAAKELLDLTRMGSFKASSIPSEGFEFDEVYKDMTKVFRIQRMIKRLGTVLPFGALKHMRNWILAIEYWQNYGAHNLKNLFLFVLKNYGHFRRVRVAPPRADPEMGIYDPYSRKRQVDLDAFLEQCPLDPDRPTIGMLLYQGMHFYDTLPILEAFADELRGRANLIPAFSVVTSNLEAMRRYFIRDGEPLIDAFVSLQMFSINNGPFGGPAEPARELLRSLNVPYFLPPKMYYRTIEQWRENQTGFAPMDVILGMTLPEIDGAIEPLVCGGPSEEGTDPATHSAMIRNRPIPGRIARIADRVERWTRLRKKPNESKRIAFVIFNYPPGEDNLGTDAYLDVFESLEEILRELKARGYQLELPSEKLHQLFPDQRLVNSPKWLQADKDHFGGVRVPVERYQEYFSDVPDGVREELTREWGEPPGEIMADGQGFLIPGMTFGNVFVGLQPSRGVHEDEEKAYHDKDLPPHHQYLAFYRWLAEDFGADAIVHVGTHGTLEFTKGKEAGLSGDCFPDLLIGPIPHIYIYWIVNASEATIAKRRGYGMLINHRSPCYTTSGLYGELQDLEDLIAEHEEAVQLDPARTEIIADQIRDTAGGMGLEFDSLEDLHSTLSKTRRAIIPRGLHVFGRQHEPEELVEYLTCVLRYDRECKSLHRILVEAQGFEYETLLAEPGGQSRDRFHDDILEEAEATTRRLVSMIVEDPAARDLSVVPDSLHEDLEQTLEFAGRLIDDVRRSTEMESLMRALDGEYIVPNVGGDEIRTPEVYPTGRNTYQFDARMIPSWSAYQRGVAVADKTLAEYQRRHGSYPRTVSVVLWGFETVKTRGETIGQILHYMGIKPVRKGPYDMKLEVVPLAELGRPRIDVLVEICGIFRDTLPNLVILLDRAARLAASLDEPPEDNYVVANARTIEEDLDPGLSSQDKARLASLRVFGPSASEYASAMRTRIETSNWESEEELAETFIDSMQYAYGEDVSAREAGDVFRGLLASVDLVSQIRDTHDYEVTDLDHYYEFSGGLTRSVELVRGEQPDTLITDTTKELIETEDISEAIARGIRTRVLNPKWIDGLLEHDYHGVQKIHERVENTLAFAATTHAVGDWVWSRITEKLLLDEEMRRRLLQNNRWATIRIADRLLEAQERGYWDASEEELEQLRQAYVEMEGWVEEET